jgi:lipopolysaccharide export system permease protein
MRFGEFRTYESPPDFFYMSSKRSLQPTLSLAGSSDPEDQAELAWRMAAPVSVFILGLLAVPLSHVGPREGRYGKLVIGIVVYVIYAQLMGLGQTWIAKGYVPGAVGLWWIHAIVLVGAIVLTLRRMGWRLRP